MIIIDLLFIQRNANVQHLAVCTAEPTISANTFVIILVNVSSRDWRSSPISLPEVSTV